MFAMRHSGARSPNRNVRHDRPPRKLGNAGWLSGTNITQGVLLVGAAGASDLRLRVAQSRLRSDLTPSHWSMAGLLDGDQVTTVALDAIGSPGNFAARNGVTRLPLDRFDDPAEFPNMAVLVFSTTLTPVLAALDEITVGRAVLDVPALTVAWLAALWGVTDLDAPLRDGKGMPGAALVELSHAIAGIELTPGLESTASCPEAIWQSARWWTDYYRETAAVAMRAQAAPSAGHALPSVPAGNYVIRSSFGSASEERKREVVSR